MNQPVCIIDDDEDVRAVMCFALEFEGIKTLPLDNGSVAINYLSKISPDEYPCLIVVDYTMPEMNGIEFIKALRRNFPETLGKIPIALSTARIPDKDEYELDNLKILIKPVDLPEFLDLAKQHYYGPLDSQHTF